MNADARFMRLEFRARQETHVIGCDRADAARLRQVHRRFRANLFAGPAGALHLEIKPVAAKDCQRSRQRSASSSRPRAIA